MIDKIQSLPPKRIGQVIGVMDDHVMAELTTALALFLGMDGISSATSEEPVTRQ